MKARSRKNSGWIDRMAVVMNRALAATSYRIHIAAANAWRFQHAEDLLQPHCQYRCFGVRIIEGNARAGGHFQVRGR